MSKQYNPVDVNRKTMTTFYKMSSLFLNDHHTILYNPISTVYEDLQNDKTTCWNCVISLCSKIKCSFSICQWHILKKLEQGHVYHSIASLFLFGGETIAVILKGQTLLDVGFHLLLCGTLHFLLHQKFQNTVWHCCAEIFPEQVIIPNSLLFYFLKCHSSSNCSSAVFHRVMNPSPFLHYSTLLAGMLFSISNHVVNLFPVNLIHCVPVFC